MKAQRGNSGIALLFLNLVPTRGGWSTPCPSHFTPGKETQYPLYRRLVGHHGCQDGCGKFLPPPEFDPRTVQPIANYTDYTISACNDNTTKANIKYEKLE
jgi:hypothetical protein